MNSATKVAEIFTAAGQAFNRLGELTMQLHPSTTDSTTSKWTDEEIEMFHSSITRFSDDLSKISLRIKHRTVSQIRQTIKKKAYEDAGIATKQIPTHQVAQLTLQNPPQQQQPQLIQQSSVLPAPQQQNVQIQHVQQIVQVQQPQAMQQHRQQIIQAQPHTKQQIIIHQQSPQQSQPQIVHIQTQPQQQTQVIHQQQIPTQTVTLAQFQQMQKAAAENAVVNSVSNTNNVAQQAVVASSGLMGTKTADVMLTLNRLNAQENEVDVECLPSDAKLEFPSDEVAG